MTPEHKALVAKLRGSVGRLTEEDCNASAAAIESLSAQSAQPQAGEAVVDATSAGGWRLVPPEATDAMWEAARNQKSFGASYRAMIAAAPASPAPANPAQVTELVEDLEQAVVDFENARSDTYNRAKKELQRARSALTAAIGAVGQAVAADIGDAVLGWMVKYDLLDGDNEYQVADVMAVMDDLVPSSALSQPHPADEHPDDRVVDRFAVAMKAKMAKKRAEGRGGWDNRDECSSEYLSYLLIQHCLKGDPLDVGNLAMMLHQRGDRIVIDYETQAIMGRPHPADEQFPQPQRKDGGEPCGECHIHPGETCDVCGATNNHPAEERVVEDWREIEQQVQPRLADGYTAVAISKPGFWKVKGPGPAAALAQEGRS